MSTPQIEALFDAGRIGMISDAKIAPPVIRPTIGRVVWYWAHPEEIERQAVGEEMRLRPAFNRVVVLNRNQPMKAEVCFVESDERVNLLVTDHIGHQVRRESVLLAQGDMLHPREPYCTWMPYQVGQAARHAA